MITSALVQFILKNIHTSSWKRSGVKILYMLCILNFPHLLGI